MLQEWQTIVTDSVRYSQKSGGGCSLILMIIILSFILYEFIQFSSAW